MAKSRRVILSFFLLFVASEISCVANGAELPFPPENKEKCSYTVTIETTCTKGAETSNNVSIRFGDTKSNDVLVHHLNTRHVKRVDPLQPNVLDDVPTKPFQACTVDEFQVMGPCVDSPICYIYLKLMGSDDWRPGLAHVRVNEATHSHLSSNYFYYRRYLPQHVWHGTDMCDTKVTPFGIKHKRKVFPRKPTSKSAP